MENGKRNVARMANGVTFTVIRMDRTPIEAPDGSTGIEDVGSALGKEIGCDATFQRESR
jgi:hypothetical protein